MGLKQLALLLLLAGGINSYDSPQVGELIEFNDAEAGYSFNYPDYWIVVTDIDEMIRVQDGSIDLIREEELSADERAAYQILIHVDGNPDYLSNVAVLVSPHQPEGGNAYPDSESAVQAVLSDFETGRASGTFFLEETYLGESHTYVYQRRVRVPEWNDEIRISYYITASRSHAYMLVKTVLVNSLTDANLDHFNQLIQSFRIEANESGNIDPSLDWGAFKPGEEVDDGELGTDVGRVEIREEFAGNSRGWPVGDDSRIRDGRYMLDSSEGFPFTVTNTSLGQIGFDFSFEGEVTFLDGDESAGFGLVFAYRDEDNYFAFLITRGGQFLVIEEKNGMVEQLVPWTSTDRIVGDIHTIMVQGDYQTITDPARTHRYEMVFYIDGNPVGAYRTERVLDIGGRFGVFVSSELNVAFDWLAARNYLLDAIMTLERFE